MKIEVPCTSANIGCGFDSLGIAFSLKAVFEFTRQIGYSFEGCEECYQNEENLIVIAYKKTMEAMNKSPAGFHVIIDSPIPIARGLGSSAAMIAAGALAANAFEENKLSMQELLEICTSIEGHPDNVAPALMGGLTVSWMEDGKPCCVPYDVSERLKFCALIPDFMISTEKAREILPKTVPLEDAIFNLSRAAALTKILEEGNTEILRYLLKDKLHEPYRKKLIHEYDRIKDICEAKGCDGFFISGSGPTLMAIYHQENFIDQIQEEIKQCRHHWQIMPLTVEKVRGNINER